MENKPIKTFHYGCIKVSLWPQKNSDHGPSLSGPSLNITPRRIYKKDDEWCSATSFGDYDMPSLIMALLECHLWCQKHKADHEETIKLPLLVESENTSDDSEDSTKGKLKAIYPAERTNGSTQKGSRIVS
jgi:hypothetical protein